MVCIELHRLLLTLKEGFQGGSCHCAKSFANKTVEEEINCSVQQGQHIGDVRHNMDHPAVVYGRHVEVIQYHDYSWRPQYGENRSYSKQNGCCFPRGVPSQAEIALSPQLVHDDGIEDEEDGAGHQVHGEAVDPDEDVVHGRADVVLAPNVGPPVVGDAGQKAGDVDAHNDLAGASRVGDGVVLEGVAHSDVPVDGQRDRDPDRRVDARKFQHLNYFVQYLRHLFV